MKQIDKHTPEPRKELKKAYFLFSSEGDKQFLGATDNLTQFIPSFTRADSYIETGCDKGWHGELERGGKPFLFQHYCYPDGSD